MRPHAGIWLTCLATAALVAGCGSSGPREPVARAQAVAYADEVNLRGADVPGWKESDFTSGESTPDAESFTATKCYGGASPHRWITWQHSAHYEEGDASLYSEVLVMPTAALASRDAAAGLSARGFACYKKEQSPETVDVGGGSTEVRRAYLIRRGPPTVTRLPSPLPGVPDSFEWRTSWTEVIPAPPTPPDVHLPHLPPDTLRIYQDTLGFVAGPAEITLYAKDLERPVPERLELQAVTAIYHRAETHKL
jgi:hypothetical protein